MIKLTENEDSYQEGQKIWNDWTRLWNGEYGLAAELVAVHFELVLTAAVKADPATINDPVKVAAWVTEVRNSFRTIHYNTVAGPYVDTQAQAISCYWEARGVFAGKTDNPEDEPGKAFHVVGTDILLLKEGRICVCRTMSKPAR